MQQLQAIWQNLMEQWEVWSLVYDNEISQAINISLALITIITISVVIHVVLHRGVLFWIKSRPSKDGKIWRDELFKGNLFSRFAFLIQGLVISAQIQLWLPADGDLQGMLLAAVELWIIVYGLLTAFSLMNVIETFLNRTAIGRNMPLKGLSQSIKVIFFIIAGLLVTSILVGKSPAILLSGLGAMTAVIMLVFKDSIMGLVAGVQLAANRMLNVGDWLEMPKYGADGDVIDISLTTVKVQNWDNTITTIPAYALVSDSFKNWKGMTESGGRRIKRSVLIDATSVHFLEEGEIEQLTKAQLMEPYIKSKVEELAQYNSEHHVDESSIINGRKMTNLGSFRVYLERYLRAHPEIHQNKTLMVRQLAPTHQGIALELYCFTSTTAWIEYERIQSDVFDHLFAVLPSFNLRVAQAPTGSDWRSISSSNTVEQADAGQPTADTQ